GLLTAERDVNAAKHAVLPVARGFRVLVQAGVADDGVDAAGGLDLLTVADDQLALAAPDGNHRVDGHDARLHGLTHGFAFDDAGRDFFDRIRGFIFDRPFAVH